MAGKGDIAAAEADQAVDALNDLMTPFTAWFKEKDETKKAEIMREMKEVTIPAWLNMMETLLTKKGGQYFAGNQLSWADLAVFNFIDSLMVQFIHSFLKSKFFNCRHA